MQSVSAETVLGNFDQGYFDGPDTQALFFTEDTRYRVKLTESDGTRIWDVKYAFGIYPLQQYLIDIGDGKLQALNIAWDARSESAGGQRWFRLDEADLQSPSDSLHWRGVYQNWNSMCADCHSTGLVKGYQPDADRFQTRFEAINVSCSACHADAKRHAELAGPGELIAAGKDLARKGSWLPGTTEHPPQKLGALSPSAQVETCGRCHALRTRLSQERDGQIYDQYSLTRLQAPLYFSDGRIREEVFVLGSFLQSKMHKAGVVCTNCHNPHTAKVWLEGNALCSQCHQAEVFDRTEHHKHAEAGPGSQCVDCHMPERTYMRVDPRKEHNFTIPDPLAAQKAGSPDTCLACHQDADRQWSVDQVSRLWPRYEGRHQWLDIQQAELPALKAFLEDDRQASLYRASLLEQKAPLLTRQAPHLIAEQLESPEALLRESGWKAATLLNPERLAPYIEAGLSDAHLSVRLAAYETLAGLKALPDSALAEQVGRQYEHYLDLQSDRPAGRTLRARYALWQGSADVAEQDLRRALDMDPAYVPARVLLSDLLRAQQQLDKAIRVLSQGLEVLPREPTLLHLRGLTELQRRHWSRALADLKDAWAAAPNNPDFGYRYAMALYHLGQKDKAYELFQQLLHHFPDHADIAKLKTLMQ